MARWETAERQANRLGQAALLRADEAISLACALPDAEGKEWLSAAPWPRAEVTQAYANLTESRTQRDETTGQPWVEHVPRRVDLGIKGFDITIGLPKSYSLLLALAPTSAAARIETIFTQTVEHVFRWVETRTSYVMRGQHGHGKTAERTDSSGFAGWVTTHRAARPAQGAPIGDPYWHVTITIANLARGTDGGWGTVAAGGRDLIRHAAALDKLTQAQIRRELKRKLGIDCIRSERTGIWEIAHIPDAAIQLFSKRAEQVQEKLAESGHTRDSTNQKKQRALTRGLRDTEPKTTTAADETLRGHWRREATMAGHNPDRWMAQLLAQDTDDVPTHLAASYEQESDTTHASATPNPSASDIAHALTDRKSGLTALHGRFSRLDALRQVADELPAGATMTEVETVTDLVLKHPAFVPAPNGETTISTGTRQQRQLGARHMNDSDMFTMR